MHTANFCVECGERLARTGWRARIRRNSCDDCARRMGTFTLVRPLIVIALIAAGAFALGKYLRPAPPPLVVERAANSPLSDLPVNLNELAPTEKRKGANASTRNSLTASSDDDAVYICGARTKKGTPCHRRVHTAGERCYQHKGMPAILPLEKLIIKPGNSSR